jgi:hypothetical protein
VCVQVCTRWIFVLEPSLTCRFSAFSISVKFGFQKHTIMEPQPMAVRSGGGAHTVTYEELLHNSAIFPMDMKTEHNRFEKLVEIGRCTKDKISSLATGTRVRYQTCT